MRWVEWLIWTTSCMLSVVGPSQSVCTTQTHRVHSTSSTSTEWTIHVTSSSAVMIDSCTSPSHAVSGVYQLMISRTWSGWRLMSRSTATSCHWRHVDCWWRHASLLVYVSTTRPTDNYYVLSQCHSTWVNCTTALRQHVVRLSLVTSAQRTARGSVRWVNCLVLSIINTLHSSHLPVSV